MNININNEFANIITVNNNKFGVINANEKRFLSPTIPITNTVIRTLSNDALRTLSGLQIIYMCENPTKPINITDIVDICSFGNLRILPTITVASTFITIVNAVGNALLKIFIKNFPLIFS